MLQIDKRQYSSLQNDAQRRSLARLVCWLRRQLPSLAQSDAELESLVVRQRRVAKVYGIDTQRSMAKWCFMAVLSGEEFHRQEAVDSFLRASGSANADRRIDDLMRIYRLAVQSRETDAR